jgi:hypothetical protein
VGPWSGHGWTRTSAQVGGGSIAMQFGFAGSTGEGPASEGAHGIRS